MYTDGFVEAHDTNGRVIGYDRSFSRIDDLICDDPTAAIPLIFARHGQWTGAAAPEDDLTLLLVCYGGCDR